MIDWEDVLIALGLICLMVAAWLVYGWLGVLVMVGLALVGIGMVVAAWRKTT